MILYHGTDIDSALDILNHGLDAAKLTALQLDRPTQLGRGWYATYEAEVAWFFASLAPGNVGRGYAVIEIEIPEDMLNQLVANRFTADLARQGLHTKARAAPSRSVKARVSVP